ncbi:ATP-binding protein [Phenylobacterium sp.]|uniref:ATP-binding protein n=1 Tax=Phenylobacterium sp. TaxID=1871053 RepID=UPI002731A026|nr:ATP-binding protein [Phenylobacterium sp.]MDP1616285.1 ATP-binding protein [Phenylobacterium sp.]MDP1987359.1 ATP-binding protein [Phenylobacterium sp.]
MRLRVTPRYLTRLIKRQLPTSLFGRSLLIIVLPVALMQVAVTWIFFDAHWDTVTSRLSDGLAGEVAWAVEGYQDDKSPEAFAVLARRAEESLSLSIVLQEGRVLPQNRRYSFFAPVDRALKRALAERLDAPFWFDTTRYPAYVDIRVQVDEGVLRVLAPRDRAFATQGHIFILWMTVATLLLTAVAILFIRNQTRAIERLASAADAFGRGVDDQGFKPHGAREVRQAAHAFLSMKSRIQRHIEQRTALLASVSHDLRTPLTRLKLELALAPPGARTADMKRDLAEMEHMIDEYLAFARGEGGESVEEVVLAPLLAEVAEGAIRAGATVRIEAPDDLTARVRPNALKRAISNLVMNAAVHGERVEMIARRLPSGGVEIAVDDDGPGIPAAQHEDAFKAFNRLDEARNQNIKGVGLGLAIARDVARGHGGEVLLDRSPLGGLRAAIRLPA